MEQAIAKMPKGCYLTESLWIRLIEEHKETGRMVSVARVKDIMFDLEDQTDVFEMADDE